MSFILHIDMNSYFASVEQQANPLLRGKPVGVCAYLSKNGCIIASSREAKAFGVKTGCLVSEAKRLCPQIILIENDPIKYRCTTEKIFKIFAEYTDRIEPYSIDEAFLDVTGYIKTYAEGEELVAKIRQRIKDEVGEWLACSAGLSWTRWLAKFAGDLAPKGGNLVIDSQAKLDQVLAKTKLIEAWGIGDRMEERLNQIGIHTLLELKKYPVANLLRVMGQYGYMLWANVSGLEGEEVKDLEETLPKSIGHSYCIPKQTNDLGYLASVLMKLCEKTGRRLRGSGLEAWGISAGYSLKGGGGHFSQRRQFQPLYSSLEIFNQAYKIITAKPIEGRVYMLAVSVTRLQKPTGQLDLFTNREQSRNLAQALDKINNRYGEYVVYHGLMGGMQDQAQDRVGYRKSVSVPEVGER